MTTAQKRSVTTVKGKVKRADGTMAERPGSHLITLPKWWCRKQGFPKAVYVSEQADGALRVEAVKDEV